MLNRVPRLRMRLIERIVRAAPKRLAGARGIDPGVHLRNYFSGVSEDDLAARDPATLAAMAIANLRLAQRRTRDRSLVQVFNPDRRTHGFEMPRTCVLIATDDMPFLVDSIGLVFSRARIAIHLLVHPVFQVTRTRAGLLQSTAAAAGRPESWQLYEIDRQLDPAAMQKLERQLLSTLADVRVAVRDWRAMRKRVLGLVDELAASPPRGADPAEVGEAQDLLRWIEGEHFILLGYRYYRLARGARTDRLAADPDSGLGILHAERGGGEKTAAVLRGTLRATARNASVLIITKASSLATVHRGTHLDYLAVKKFDRRGQTCGEHRFLGLWTSTAYFASPREIPVLRRKAAAIIDVFGLDPSSHDGKAVLAVLETYPRDELFQASVAELVDIVRGVVNLYERHTTRLMLRRDPFGRFYSCMIYVPRDRYATQVRQRIERIVLRAFDGTDVESQVQMSESNHARVHIVVRTKPGTVHRLDRERLEQDIATAAMTWSDRLRNALLAAHAPEQAMRLAARYETAFPVAYQDEVDAAAALEDIERIERLGSAADALQLNLQRVRGAAAGRVHLRLCKPGVPIPISDLLPMMESFGLRVLSEHPYALALPDGSRISIQDFEFEQRTGAAIDVERVEARFIAAFIAVWRGEVENDGLHQLLFTTQLDVRTLVMLRAYCRYLRQIALPFSLRYVETVVARNPQIAAGLAQLFERRFDPAQNRKRRGTTASLEATLQRRLDSLTSADEDRILRTIFELLRASLRTNFYQRRADGTLPPALSVKFACERIAALPLPRPKYEIFVYSPRVEGVHLRKGAVARGGIRWSDRPEDFRTEVLGLMKAQNVKNTLIVPVGAKGGFVPKRQPQLRSREEIQQEGIAAYRIFIGSLLDVTDNIVNGKIVAPLQVVRHDGDDPYLVVAADKGTATFSDIANAISVERGFWLGDAFASGGSAGYDHKKMGITARGAWECVKRHFRELGVDIQSEDFTVAGVGDMSGDVFGNGMLLSPHIKLVAAFNHLHIFLDPTPDPARSLKERTRLFALPRSGWDDYDRKLISHGGGIFARSAKSIAIAPEVRKLLDLTASTVSPNELIQAILKSRVDLLWNGGIGTYAKSSEESNGNVGDRSNDALRVNGAELRARVVGEGGNLGFTQLARVEYALAGGRINTDFIDNSAGVNTSDVEVNLKILLSEPERRGTLKRRDRDLLLARMTEAVGSLVLRNNYLQSQALSTLEAQAANRLPELQQLIRSLERSGELNRAIEFLPDEETLAERRKRGLGLTRPELAMLLSYSKIVLNQQLLNSDVPEDRYLSTELERYFPAPVQKRFRAAIRRHRLRREIIATATTNSLVNRMGPSFMLRAVDDTGATAAEVARAYSIVRDVFDMRSKWAAIEALDNRVACAVQYELMFGMSRLLRHASYWLLRQPNRSLDVASGSRRFGPGIRELSNDITRYVVGGARARLLAGRQRLQQAGVPQQLAEFSAAADSLDVAFDIVVLAEMHRARVGAIAQVYFAVSERLGLEWLRDQVEKLNVDGNWQAIARTGLRDTLQRVQKDVADRVLAAAGGRGARSGAVMAEGLIDSWTGTLGERLATWQRALADIRSAGAADFATLSVGVEAVQRLLR